MFFIYVQHIIIQQFQATQEELHKLVELFRSNNSETQAVGVNLENLHYIVPLVAENLIFGKKDKCGFFAVKTKTGNFFDISFNSRVFEKKD